MNTTKNIDHSFSGYSKKKAFARELKATAPWRWAVQGLFPAFEYLWKNVAHGPERRLYEQSKYFTAKQVPLNRTALKLVENDPQFVIFAKWLKEQIPAELIEKKRQEMLATPAEVDDGAFAACLTKHLSDEAKFGILKFALSDSVLARILPYFEIVPHLQSVAVMLNVAKPGQPVVGSQQWHRDGDIYKAMNIFMCLTDVDEESGEYHAIGKDLLPYYQAIPIEAIDHGRSIWHNGRHTDAYMEKFVPRNRWTRLAGKPGTAALVDPALCYHKGGHCRSRDRLMINIRFVADMSWEFDSIINDLGLLGHPGVASLLDNDVKKHMVTGCKGRWYHKRRKDHPSFLIARRILTFNKKL